MASFFLILMLLSLVALIIGLFSPRAVVLWSDKKSRGKAAGVYGIAVFVFFVTFGIASDNEPAAKVEEIKYSIAKKDSNGRYIDMRIVIPYRYDKATLLKIAKRLKDDRHWDRKFSIFFNYRVPVHSGAFASTVYGLKNCSDCILDGDGNPVQFRQIEPEQNKVNKILTLDYNKPEKKVLASYIDFTAKVQIVKIKDKILQVWMSTPKPDYFIHELKKVGDRYFLVDPVEGDEEMNYQIRRSEVWLYNAHRHIDSWPLEP
jgi:hypothetical protein